MTKQEALDMLAELERKCLEAESSAHRREHYDYATNMHGHATAYRKAIQIVEEIEYDKR